MKHLAPLKAIRKHCLACAGRPKFVRECSNTECDLFMFKSGHNPARKRIGPSACSAKSIPNKVLPNSTTDSDKIMAGKSCAMPKDRSLNQVAAGGEIRPIKMEGQGRVEICRANKELVIKVITEN